MNRKETAEMETEINENGHAGHIPGGPEVARRFRLLLDMFPRADGERWRGAEVEEASGGVVTGSYFSALIKGKFQRPGIVQLSALSDVIGFPFELWRLPTELWDEYLEQNPARGSFRTAAPGRSPGSRRGRSLRTWSRNSSPGALTRRKRWPLGVAAGSRPGRSNG